MFCLAITRVLLLILLCVVFSVRQFKKSDQINVFITTPPSYSFHWVFEWCDNVTCFCKVDADWLSLFFSSLTTPYCQYFDFYHHLDHVDNLCHWNLRSLCYGRKDHTIVCTCTILPSHDVQFFTSIYTGQFTETAPPKTEPKAHRICRLCKEQLCQRAFTV